MKKVFLVLLALVIVAGIWTTSGQQALAAETVKIGFNAPLSGPSAAWGLPGLEGVAIWLDKVNSAGGIQAGNKKYKVEIVKYDNQGIGSKALLGARKLVLEDKVVAMLMLGGPTSDVAQPFLTKHKILTFVLVASDIAKKRPYLMDVTDNFPVYHTLDAAYIAKTHPKAKRVAIISQDDAIGLAAIAWSEAGFKAAGMDVVYSKPFAMETTDFAPIVTAALASKPDIISTGATYPEFQALIFEQAHAQGWNPVATGGCVTSACWDFHAITAKVPVKWMDGAVSNFPDFDDPQLSAAHHEFWDAWKERFPRHSFSEIVWEFQGGLGVWKYGVEKAGSVDPMKVYKALKASKTVPHSFGPGVWWGKEVFGISNLLVPNWPITEVHDGKPHIVAHMNFIDWLKEGHNREILYSTLKKWKMMK
jgi:branched-chain amino acid transport system substrate-binding protein